MEEWSKEIMAKNLRYYMDRCGKSQKDLAEIAGVSGPTFSDWINAKKYPRIDKIQKLADFFGILKSDLIEDKKKNSPNELPLTEGVSAPDNRSGLSENKEKLIRLIQDCPEEKAGRLLQVLQLFLHSEE